LDEIIWILVNERKQDAEIRLAELEGDGKVEIAEWVKLVDHFT